MDCLNASFDSEAPMVGKLCLAGGECYRKGPRVAVENSRSISAPERSDVYTSDVCCSCLLPPGLKTTPVSARQKIPMTSFSRFCLTEVPLQGSRTAVPSRGRLHLDIPASQLLQHSTSTSIITARPWIIAWKLLTEDRRAHSLSMACGLT